jgi:DNA end-binding protein Ku
VPRPTWKGHISFGLVNVPVTLYPAEQKSDLSFKLVDSRNSARVRYERVNEATGEEVPWSQIVKGYEYDDGNYVLLSNEDLETASPELTKVVEIERFVSLDEIDPVYFDKPYYLVPAKGAEKGYVLLREAMQRAGRVGIAQVVIRSRGSLAALVPRGNALLLELLRYGSEVRSLDDYDVPRGEIEEYGITEKELKLAGQLVDGMAAEWDPHEFHDDYRDSIMKLIESRIKSGELQRVTGDDEEQVEAPTTINFMDVLKQSVKETSKPSRRKTSRKRRSSDEKAS